MFCFQNASAAESSVAEIYLGSREGDPASLVDNVSTIHGDYTEVEVDLTVASPDSLVLSRFYSSRDPLSVASLGGWRFNTHCFLTMKKDPGNQTYTTSEGTFERTFVYVGNPEGSILTYVGWRNITNPTKRILFKIDAEDEAAGLANTARGDVGAWTNLKNNELYYNPQSDSFELLLCTEGTRFYTKNPVENLYTITHEILPSGNKIFYEFSDKNQLTLIKQTNGSEKKVLAWIKIEYENGVHLETSDGKSADYQFQQDPSGTQLLTTVIRSNKPDLHYQYQVLNDHALLIKKTLPEGRFVGIDYYIDKTNECKVKAVTIPGGVSGTFTKQFIYDQNCTQVDGPGSGKTVYRFNEGFHLVAIEQYLDGSLYRINQKSWGGRSDAGNLISNSIADRDGNIFYHKYIAYDKRNNISEEREYGDSAGTGPIVLAVDEDKLVSNQDGHVKNYSYFLGKTTHGFFQVDSKGTGVKYWYKKGTNLLVKKLVLTNGSLDSEEEGDCPGIKQRYFYTYNEDAALVKVVVDDGYAQDSKNLSGVNERLITNIVPKQEMPNVGIPEITEQKYSSSNGKLEFLLKKTVNHFDIEGNVVSQEVFDANEAYCYTVAKKFVNGLLVLETDPLGNETQYSYDANLNLILEKRSDTGISIEYKYDLRNRLVHTVETDEEGNHFETQMSYDSSGFKSSETDQFGNETTYVNDSLGRPISITYPETSSGLHSSITPTYTYAYDLFDHPISVTDPKGRVLTKSYNVKGKLAEINYLDGTKEAFRYDSGGNLHHHYCRNGILEVFEYDFIGRLNNIKYFRKGSDGTDYSFKERSCKYNIFHKISEIDELKKATFYTYDGSGRLTCLKKESQTVEFIYDSLGRSQGIKKWTSSKDYTLDVKEYDFLDRIIEERTEGPSGHILNRKKFIYNSKGELAEIIGYPNNKESILMQYEYDGFGRLCKATDAMGSVTQIIYDNFFLTDWGQKGSKRILLDPMGNRTEEILDADEHVIQTCKKDQSGRLLSCIETSYDFSGHKLLEKAIVISKDEPLRNYEIEYSYNQCDQLESVILGKGTSEERSTRFEYNSYGELTKKYNPGFQEPITYQYSKEGDLKEVSYKENKKDVKFKLNYDCNRLIDIMKDNNLFIKYAYDGNNLPISEKIQDEFGSYQVSRTYNGEGKIQILQFPDGSYVEYTYEGPLVKRVSRFNKDKIEIYSYQISSRDQMSNPLKEILPGILGERTQVWDGAGRRTGIVTDIFQDKVLEYGLRGDIKKRETILKDKFFAADYDYNALLQLTLEKSNIEHHYSYDSIGNRLKRDGSSYKINELNELIEAEGKAYTYHPNGNIATKTLKGNTWTYQSNPLNQIVSVKDADQNMVSFTYDLTGKRLSKRIDAKGKKSKILRFFYLDETEIGCVDEKGIIVELKIPSNPNNSESPCIAIEAKREIYVPMYDLQGNIVCLLDHTNRKVVESYRYSIYGEEEITNQAGKTVSNSLVGNPWRYRGKRVDKETGLIYFGYRYYDPEIGRWVSPDPLGTIDGPNLYAFVHNNPLKYVDDFGFNAKTDENCGCTQHDHPGWHNAPPDCVCICGKDGTGTIPGSYRSKRGSDIKSTLGGISHGVLDFFVDSFHEIHTAAAYAGSAELDMSLHERIRMIEAVELSQMQRRGAVGSQFMGMLSIDESDAIYQSFRSNTTLGLQIGSLVAGGYGAVKGIIGFSRLARMPMQGPRIVRGIWTSTKKRTSVQNAYKHWKDHGHEFSELLNSKQYVEHAHNFFAISKGQQLTKVRPNGDILIYNVQSNTFGAFTKDGVPKTVFKPMDGIIYWETRN